MPVIASLAGVATAKFRGNTNIFPPTAGKPLLLPDVFSIHIIEFGSYRCLLIELISQSGTYKKPGCFAEPERSLVYALLQQSDKTVYGTL